MVLEEATAGSDSFPSSTDEGFLPSDGDTYGSHASFRSIDWSSLPHPAVIGFTSRRRALIETELRKVEDAVAKHLDRPTTTTEADQISWTLAAGHTLSLQLHTLIIMAALGQCYRRRADYTVAFFISFKNLPNFSPDKLGPLAGRHARIGWHALRAFSYFGLAHALSPVPSGGVIAGIRMQRNEKLKEVNDAVVAEGAELVQRRNDAREAAMTSRRQAGNAPGQRGGIFGSSPPMRGAPGRASSGDDDMSPTGGAGVYSYDRTDSTSAGEVEASTTQSDWVSDTSQGSRAGSDHASPTAARAPDAQHESPWERLRRQAAAGQSNGAGSEGRRRRSWERAAEKRGERNNEDGW